MQKKYIVSFLVLVVLVGAALFGYLQVAKHIGKKSGTQTAGNTSTPSTLSTKDIDVKTVPALFPRGVPTGQTSDKVITNQEQGDAAALRSYLTAKPRVDVVKEYEKYFADNGWKITDKISSPTSNFYATKKGDLILNVQIADNKIISKTQVDVKVEKAQ